ncbi:MAG: hypothetical protein GY866_42670 [Proteobacteria bacterium]|nr:hypothetical protein [Pseudomonadota bacterium]
MRSDIVEVISEGKELEKYTDPIRLMNDAIPYIGQPKQNKSDPDKIFIRLNPLSTNGALLEFKTKDVVFAENVKTVSQKDGSAFQIVKIWIRKGSIGIKLEPFSVMDFTDVFAKDFDEP